jgi:drug/metabolite transporter (DMT)-like permease
MRPPGVWRRLLPFGAFLTCALIWSSTFLVIRVGNDNLPPMWASALRLGLAAAILLPLARAMPDGLPRGAARRTAIAYGIAQFGVNFPLLYWGETAVPSGIAAVVYSSVPLWSAGFAHLLGLERLRPLKIAGALVAMGGVAVVCAGSLRGVVPPLPLLSVLAAAVTASFATALLKRGPRHSALGVNAIGTLAGFPVALLGSLALREPHPIPHTLATLGPLLYLTVAGSIVAFVVVTWLIQRWPVTSSRCWRSSWGECSATNGSPPAAWPARRSSSAASCSAP